MPQIENAIKNKRDARERGGGEGTGENSWQICQLGLNIVRVPGRGQLAFCHKY